MAVPVMTSQLGVGYWIGFLVGIAALIGVASWAMAASTRSDEESLQRLEDRLARGEIDAKEFERLRAKLKRTR